jgi:hypothetical protein
MTFAQPSREENTARADNRNPTGALLRPSAGIASPDPATASRGPSVSLHRHASLEGPTSEVVVTAMRETIRLHGKPERV